MISSAGKASGAGILANGWFEAALFVITLSVLNISYALGHQMGAHPVAFIVYAMPFAALMLLAVTGLGPDWRAIASHPMSFVVGAGIIGMEAVYYLLLEYVSPTDGSILVRLGLPIGMLIGFVLLGRRPRPVSILGALIVVAGIGVCLAGIDEAGRPTGIVLGIACAVITSSRSFATELHPWNRSAATVTEKMRITGIVLIVTSALGIALVAAAIALVQNGAFSGPAWLPAPRDFLHPPTIVLALFIGCLVLTAMQYLAFSTVVKIRTENFLAMTALIPLSTLVFQIGAVELQLLKPVAVDWRTLVATGILVAGVMLVVWGGRHAHAQPAHGSAPGSAEGSTSPMAPPRAAAAASSGIVSERVTGRPPRRQRPWTAILAATLLGLPFGTIYAFSVLLKPLESLLGVPRAELSFVFGLSAIGFTVGMNLAPALFGRLSAAALLGLATVGNIAGLAISAMANGTTALAIGYGILFGISGGLAFTTYQQGINLVVTGKRQGLVNGYVVSLFPTGAMIGAPLLDWAIGIWGVRAALGGLGAIFGIVGVMSVALFAWGGIAVTEPPRPLAAGDAASTVSGRRAVFWKIFAVFFVAAAAGLMVLSQAAGIVAAYGGEGAVAVFATTAITGAIAAARLAGGLLVDRFPVPHVMAGAQAFALLGTIVLTLWPGPYVAVITLAMIGMGYGFISGSTAAAIGRYWEKREFGRVASRLYIAWCIAAVTLPILAARVFDLTGGYAAAVVIAGFGNLVGVLVAWSLPRKTPG
jgi:MFS transporter, OFA family, oxalate/formate antiporter